MGIEKIDYSSWTNQKAIQLAKQVDKDGVKGLQGKEIFNFTRSAIDNNIAQTEIKELLGLNISSKTRAGNVTRSYQPTNPDFNKAVDFYNSNMTSNQRYSVTRSYYDNLETRLYNMEKDIDKAFQECEAYSDIVIIPRWHYRFYPRVSDQLINFDIEELRTRTTKDMESLQKLKDDANRIIEEANGEKTHTQPEKTHYDVDEIALKYFDGMSYEEFAAKYKNELDYCKYVTYADYNKMNETQAYVYGRAKAYATEMLNTTVSEAHNVNWDISRKKLDATLQSSGDMMTISDFEYDGITEDGLAQIQSGISYKAFEDALIDKYNELNGGTSIESGKTDSKQKKAIKRVVNGAVLIFNPDGSIYDLNGNKIK